MQLKKLPRRQVESWFLFYTETKTCLSEHSKKHGKVGGEKNGF